MLTVDSLPPTIPSCSDAANNPPPSIPPSIPQTHRPHPIDIQSVGLPPSLAGDLSTLAQQLHFQWCFDKLLTGWSYGAIRNDELKHHPLMKPFWELDAAAQARNRVSVEASLKCILALGYTVVRKPTEQQHVPASLARIALSGELVVLGDLLAENDHEVWATEYFQNGWTDPTAPDVDQLKELLHSLPEHSKHRFFFVVRVLHTIWTRTQSAWTDCVDRFAPLLFRDGVSAVRSINHMAGMAAAKKCLSVVLQHLDFMSRDDTKMMVDDLIQYTVHAVLFEYPPLKPPPPLTTRPEIIEPTLVVQGGLPETTPLVTELPHDFLIQKPQESQGQSVLKLQAMVRGWLSRRWSGLALLYRGNLSSSVVPSCSIPTNKSPYCRRQYLALTKRVLYWSVEKLELEKARVKGQLKAFNDTFELNRGSRPLVTDKAAVRPLYELYHFLGLIMDYQRTEPSVDPSDE
ncbi:hypothetical protein DYB31_011503 [Aphanomyces astaci]|uniref:Ryanodine receptor Ryr domain-containing protein n=1 Tax=Aphanomyces astaci TaxID=112090 RepID=A0A397F2H1_APHAT|nr:hypothetical protein DYB31_011503 [Aphanomyces astaci]